MAIKSKKIPQINHRVSVNIGDIVIANITPPEKNFKGVVTKKILRLESYSHGERIDDLITAVSIDGTEKIFDRGFIVSSFRYKPSNVNYTNTVYGDNGDFTGYDTLVVKTKKDIYESISLKYLILFFGRRIYKKNPKDVPLTYIDEYKLNKIDLTTIPGIKSIGTTNLTFVVRGKIFEKWVRRNIFKISKTHFETWQYNTHCNKVYEKNYFEDLELDFD